VIRVSHLSKSYGARQAGGASPPALDDVSFEVGRGEIVALLGPNGAGKTTMLRILTGFLAPTGGDAQLAGHSIHDGGVAMRRQLGYLPEGVPLYPDMRVDEYLTFRARLRGIARADRARLIDRALGDCGLGDRRRQIIGTLSRGYRQRVGLCDAILARPPILILDEPTVGLDPNQIRDVRQLILALAREATVLLSTHILSEVETLRARVVILHRGRVVATRDAGASGEADARGGRVVVSVRPEDRARALALFRALAGVGRVDERPDGSVAVVPVVPALAVVPVLASDQRPEGPAAGASAAGADLGEQLFRAAADAGLTLRELRRESSSLEEIFARITTGGTDAADA
jgi:ABC-2 type transport system ATP-binding protein